MKIYLLRHGKTFGNLKKRYIGRTDEPLCEQGRTEILERRYDLPVEKVFVSPLLRCRETAALIWPDMPQHIVEDLRECDFGLFENKNYQELADCPQYQEWVDSMGQLPFPEGESRTDFAKRCRQAFFSVLKSCEEEGIQSIGMVVHGGTIMAVMEQVAVPSGSYYDFQAANGNGYFLQSCEGGFAYDRIFERESC